MSVPSYLQNYNVQLLDLNNEKAGNVLYTTFGILPSNNLNENVYSLCACGYIDKRSSKYSLVFDFSKQNLLFNFNGPVSGNFNICDKVINISKMADYEYREDEKKFIFVLNFEKLDFRVSNNVLFSINVSINSNDISKSCSLEKLSEETSGFTEINGSTPPGQLATLVDSHTMLSTKNVNGDCVLMVKSIRKAGTRVGIHVHKYGGYTLILKGTMTDFVQGQEIKTYSNSGYYMPPCLPMSAANLGEEDVELIDIFIGPPGEPFIEIMEPNWPFERIERFPE
jgi:mannose-6-phosphate isomerase-like protein (cupin superfamily)